MKGKVKINTAAIVILVMIVFYVVYGFLSSYNFVTKQEPVIIDSTAIYSTSAQRKGEPWEVIVHHTGVNQELSPCDIDEYHSRVHGWTCGVSYHYYVKEDGTITQLHPDGDLTVHTVNHNNSGIAVCFSGMTPTENQMMSMAYLICRLMKQYNISIDNVKGHGDVNATECPGFNLYTLKEIIKVNL